MELFQTNLGQGFKYHYRPTAKKIAVDRARYAKIVSGFMKFIVDKVFEGYDVKLSTGDSLGTVSISGRNRKPKLDNEGNIINAITDWVSTNKLWKENPEAKAKDERVYFFNEHSNNIYYRIEWSIKGMTIANKYLYLLDITKGSISNKRRLAHEVKAGKEYKVRQTKETDNEKRNQQTLSNTSPQESNEWNW